MQKKKKMTYDQTTPTRAFIYDDSQVHNDNNPICQKEDEVLKDPFDIEIEEACK